jgi:sec-independent protein translocase protein TatA
MGGLSIWHILLVAVVVLVLFGGRGKISDIMGDFAKGIKSFKKGLSDEEQPPKTIPSERRDEASNKDTASHS